jgi:hypothetical protein
MNDEDEEEEGEDREEEDDEEEATNSKPKNKTAITLTHYNQDLAAKTPLPPKTWAQKVDSPPKKNFSPTKRTLSGENGTNNPNNNKKHKNKSGGGRGNNR